MRYKRFAPFLALIVALALPSSASAAVKFFDGPRSIEVHIVNSNGVPQPGARTWVSLSGSKTPLLVEDGGFISSKRYTVGARVWATRAAETSALSFDPASAPEGEGVSYLVKNDSPSQVELVLPALGDSDYSAFEPELSVTERAFVGLLNDYRSKHNLYKLEISKTLSDVNDRYARFLAYRGATSVNPDPHTQVWSNVIRAADGGYPRSTAGEAINFAFHDSASILSSFLGSQGHKDLLMTKEAETIGVGRAQGPHGNAFVVTVSYCPEREPYVFYDSCGTSGDIGDPSLAGSTADLGESDFVAAKAPLALRAAGRPGKRSARVRVSCASDCSVVVSGTMRVGHKRIRMAPKRVDLAAGERRLVVFRYKPRAQRLLRKSKRGRLLVSAHSAGKSRFLRLRIR